MFPFEKDGLTAKYAVLSEDDLHRFNGRKPAACAVWARFAQPSRLCGHRTLQHGIGRSTRSRAAPTLLAAAGRIAEEPALNWWRRAFALTYSAELRAERQARAGSVVDSEPERYRRFSSPAMAAITPGARARGGWARRRLEGKALSVLRLAKASATFAGGVDYSAWKINRHAGTQIQIKPWQRRWPLLAAISLLPRLLRSGAVR